MRGLRAEGREALRNQCLSTTFLTGKETGMRLEQLEYLVAVAKAGSISAAARRLNVSRQAVSVAVGNLEEELGFPFFKKGNKGIELTSRGVRALEKAEGALKLIAELRLEGKENAAGAFSVCTTPLLSLFLTRNIFLPFRERYPDISVTLCNVYITDVMKELEGGASRMAVTRTAAGLKIREQAVKMGCEIVPLYTDEERLFIGAGHPLAARDTLTPEDLKTLRIGFYSKGQEHISRLYAPYFAGEYRMANRTDLLDLVVRNEAAFIQPYRLFRHDYRVAKGDLTEKAIPLPQVDPSVPIAAICMPELSFPERLFWDYLIKNFTNALL